MTPSVAPLGEYLRARREALSPAEVGISPGPYRRVAGLRRQEVAHMANISYQYYLRIEQGRHSHPSVEVIAALSEALRLGDAGVMYMTRLVDLHSMRGRINAAAQTTHVTLENLVLEPYTEQAAFISDRNYDMVAANDLARTLTGNEWDAGSNLVVSVFGDRMRRHLENWEWCARRTVAALRFRANPFDPRLRSLVEGLMLQSPYFARIWKLCEAQPAYFESYRHRVEGQGTIGMRVHTFEVPGTQGWTVTAVGADALDPKAAAVMESLGAARGTQIPMEA